MLTTLLLWPLAAPATPTFETPTQVHAVRVTSPPRIDGILDDDAWQRPPNNGLIQQEPDNGSHPIHLTDWWISYDDEALYAAFRLHDSAPDSIDRSVARRDAPLLTDEVYLELDTFNDDRNGYLFVVGAGGYILDAVMFNDGWWDNSWDAVWSSAARVDADGWIAEMRIPFSQLNFPDDTEQVWGINIVRNCKRYQSTDYLFHRPRDESGYVSRYPDLVGMNGIEPTTRREGLVYGVSKGEYLQASEGDPFNDGSELEYDVGGDLKWGLTSNLTLNATINPDFGQVEVDPAVVNLSDFETFFQEKRPFFVQDAGTFRFGRDGTNNNWNFNWMDPMLLYSRRVGRSPQLGLSGDADYVQSPGGTTILGAAKLTGKTGNTTVGALSAVTAREHHQLALDGGFSKELAEPATVYNVVRATRSSDDADHEFGVMFTGTERNLSTSASRDALPRRAYAGGIDGWTYLDGDQRWAMKGYVAGSWIQGDADAIDGRQRSSRHYFQRPDADHIDYNPDRTDLAGWISRLMINKQKGDYRINAAFGAVSPGFEVSDLGFQSRSDNINTHVAAGKRWSDPVGILRRGGFDLASYWTWDFGGTRTGGGAGAFYWAHFTNYWSIDGSVFFNPKRDDTRTTRGGPTMRTAISREYSFGVRSDSRKSWGLSARGGQNWGAPGERSAWGGVDFEVKPTSALKLSVGPHLSWDRYGAQYVTTFEDPLATHTFGSRYVFADILYQEISASMRVDWSFTPFLTLQSYVQPLIAVGDYRRIKEFAEPGTREFDVYGEAAGTSIDFDPEADEYAVTPGGGGEAFTVSNPDFNFKSLRLNMVLRWEYSPGSTLYLVWTRSGTNFDRPGRFDLRADADDLLNAPSDDVVMLKVTRWFDF